MGTLGVVQAAIGQNPVDLVTALVDAVGARSNDAKAKAEFEELIRDITLELAKKWKDFEDRDRPSADDVAKALKKLATAHHRANNHKKRRVLWNAFWNSLNPEFYNEGVHNILWEKVERLEYPDFLFLDKVVKSSDPAKRSHCMAEGAGGRGKWRGDQFPIFDSDPEAEFAERLSNAGLISLEPGERGGVLLVSRRGLAKELAKFALEEFWKEEAAQPASPRGSEAGPP